MNIRIPIYISIISIFSSSQPMEIIKKKIKKYNPTNIIKETNSKKYKNCNIITKEFFATQKILDKNKTFPKEVMLQIRQYCILLHDKELQDNKILIEKWNDFNIPLQHYRLLTPKQKDVLEYMFTSHPYIDGSHGMGKNPEINYILKSTKQYDHFITLPVELRECLALLPKSILEQQHLPYSPIPINPNATIQVTTATANILPNEGHFYDSVPKPIVPEEGKFVPLLKRLT